MQSFRAYNAELTKILHDAEKFLSISPWTTTIKNDILNNTVSIVSGALDTKTAEAILSQSDNKPDGQTSEGYATLVNRNLLLDSITQINGALLMAPVRYRSKIESMAKDYPEEYEHITTVPHTEWERLGSKEGELRAVTLEVEGKILVVKQIKLDTCSVFNDYVRITIQLGDGTKGLMLTIDYFSSDGVIINSSLHGFTINISVAELTTGGMAIDPPNIDLTKKELDNFSKAVKAAIVKS